MKSFPLRLENSFFPHQEVRANPVHDTSGNKAGTEVNINHAIQRIKGRENTFGVELTISADEEMSDNPPYFFTISGYAIFVFNDEDGGNMFDEHMFEIPCVQMLIGAIRERLSSITSRAPWGTFTLNMVPMLPHEVDK